MWLMWWEHGISLICSIYEFMRVNRLSFLFNQLNHSTRCITTVSGWSTATIWSTKPTRVTISTGSTAKSTICWTKSISTVWWCTARCTLQSTTTTATIICYSCTAATVNITNTNWTNTECATISISTRFGRIFF